MRVHVEQNTCLTYFFVVGLVIHTLVERNTMWVCYICHTFKPMYQSYIAIERLP